MTLTAGQRSHLQTLREACLEVDVLGFTAGGGVVVRRVDHRAVGDPARDVTYTIVASGAGIAELPVVVSIDDDSIYDMSEQDFELVRG